jgi:hypothetical protein
MDHHLHNNYNKSKFFKYLLNKFKFKVIIKLYLYLFNIYIY